MVPDEEGDKAKAVIFLILRPVNNQLHVGKSLD